MFLETLPVLPALMSFIVVMFASRFVGQWFSRLGLPTITGYLFTGVLAGPFILEMLPEGASENLRFIDELSLAVIAFVAGSELYLKELRDRLRSILTTTATIVVASLLLIGTTITLLTATIPFTADMGLTARIAVAVLGTTILLALSPASTIAVIQEMRARGPFTQTVLSIAVVMDVVIIVLFAIATAFAGTLLTDAELNASFVLLLALDLLLALVLGLATARFLAFVLASRLSRALKIAYVLVTGLVIFMFAFWIDELKLGIHVEPLLQAMIVGFFMTNFTPHRDEFAEILHDVGPAVYVAFFTLTGVALKLDTLLATIGVALALFVVRILGISVGAFAGSSLVRDEPRFRRLLGLGLVTQAGIALGLARETAIEFPELGDEFATLVIAVVVLNEIFGPILLKGVLTRAGEAHTPEKHEPDAIRDALVLGVEGQSLALARQLQAHGWRVIVADTDPARLETLAASDVDERHLPAISEAALGDLITTSTDAVVAMLDNDDANYRACELAYEHFGIRRLVVRLNDLSDSERFTAIGAVVVEPATAIVNVIDQAVRLPQSAALLMHQDPDYDIVQITLTEPGVDGTLLRDLRLPDDVLVLEISRNGFAVVPNGSSRLHRGDDVTFVGKPASLREMARRFGY